MWWRNIFLPFENRLYIWLSLLVMWLVFSTTVWFANRQLILLVWSSDLFTISDKIILPLSLYGAIGTNFSFFSASTTIAITILFGIQVALLTYYIKQKQAKLIGVTSTTSIIGVISGFFGIGCAACGTLIITSLLSLVGAGGLLLWLPFGGQEFGLLGVGLLVYSIYYLAKKLNSPLVCNIL